MIEYPAPHRLQIKIAFQDPLSGGFDALVPVLHTWITEARLDDVLIDVADYKHVPDGPGILLIGHKADWAYDEVDGQPGFRYQRKRQPEVSLQGDVEAGLNALLEALDLLQVDYQQAFIPRFDQFEVTLLDRLRYPNAEDNQRDAGRVVQAAFASYFGEGTVVHVAPRQPDARLPLSFVVAARLPVAPSYPYAIKKVEAEV